MRLPFLLFTLIALVCVSCSCGGPRRSAKERYLADYQQLLLEVKENYASIPKREWRKLDSEFKGFISNDYERYEARLTAEEKKMIWQGALEYYYYRYGGVDRIINPQDPIAKLIKGNTEIFLEDTEKTIQGLRKLIEDKFK